MDSVVVHLSAHNEGFTIALSQYRMQHPILSTLGLWP